MPRLLEYGDIWAFERPTEWEFADAKQNRAVDLWQSGELEEAARLFVEVIEKHSDHFDAMNNLACLYRERGLITQAVKLWQKIVDTALSSFPDNFVYGRDEISWRYTDNRSFLLALSNLTVNSFEQGDEESARKYAEILLTFCPDDNLGIRVFCKKKKIKL